MVSKNRTFFGVLGVIILIFGAIGTIVIAIKGEQYFYVLPITGIAVIMGVLLIAWTFTN